MYKTLLDFILSVIEYHPAEKVSFTSLADGKVQINVGDRLMVGGDNLYSAIDNLRAIYARKFLELKGGGMEIYTKEDMQSAFFESRLGCENTKFPTVRHETFDGFMKWRKERVAFEQEEQRAK